jgi:hypothetical protein
MSEIFHVTPQARYVIREEWGNPPEPAPKHDGNLPGANPYVVKIINLMGIVRDVRIGHDQAYVDQYGAEDEIWLSAQQFLSLMEWGEENKERIQRLAKEQGE